MCDIITKHTWMLMCAQVECIFFFVVRELCVYAAVNGLEINSQVLISSITPPSICQMSTYTHIAPQNSSNFITILMYLRAKKGYTRNEIHNNNKNIMCSIYTMWFTIQTQKHTNCTRNCSSRNSLERLTISFYLRCDNNHFTLFVSRKVKWIN